MERVKRVRRETRTVRERIEQTPCLFGSNRPFWRWTIVLKKKKERKRKLLEKEDWGKKEEAEEKKLGKQTQNIDKQHK